jgi:uncharacterized protein YbaA (DUF1428 family)
MMSYVQGFVLAVPSANKQAYVDHATKAVDLFREFGMTRLVECWGDDVPHGKMTDFHRAVQAKDDETVVFSWCEWPSADAYRTGMERMIADPRMEEIGEMPFDGKRMIFAGFAPLLDHGPGGTRGYVDGYLVPVETGNRDVYREMAGKAAPIFLEHGATRIVETWGDDVPRGELTDFYRAVDATDGETVVFSWVEWPDKPTRDAGSAKVMADPRMQPDAVRDMPFDGKRMIYGGFAPVLDA